MSEETVEYRTRNGRGDLAPTNCEIQLNVNLSPKESAHLGILCLKEAVLAILKRHEHSEEGLTAGKISKDLGIQTFSGTDYLVVTGILRELKAERRVRKLEKRKGWRLIK